MNIKKGDIVKILNTRDGLRNIHKGRHFKVIDVVYDILRDHNEYYFIDDNYDSDFKWYVAAPNCEKVKMNRNGANNEVISKGANE